MGKKIIRKVYRLSFADGSDLDGASITLRSLTYDELDTMYVDPADPEISKKADARLQLLADRLVAWDLEEEDGTPIPPTVQGLRSLELITIGQIIDAWTTSMTTVSPPLPEGSPSGAKSALEASIPMTPTVDSSPSLQS